MIKRTLKGRRVFASAQDVSQLLSDVLHYADNTFSKNGLYARVYVDVKGDNQYELDRAETDEIVSNCLQSGTEAVLYVNALFSKDSGKKVGIAEIEKYGYDEPSVEVNLLDYRNSLYAALPAVKRMIKSALDASDRIGKGNSAESVASARSARSASVEVIESPDLRKKSVRHDWTCVKCGKGGARIGTDDGVVCKECYKKHYATARSARSAASSPVRFHSNPERNARVTERCRELGVLDFFQQLWDKIQSLPAATGSKRDCIDAEDVLYNSRFWSFVVLMDSTWETQHALSKGIVKEAEKLGCKDSHETEHNETYVYVVLSLPRGVYDKIQEHFDADARTTASSRRIKASGRTLDEVMEGMDGDNAKGLEREVRDSVAAQLSSVCRSVSSAILQRNDEYLDFDMDVVRNSDRNGQYILLRVTKDLSNGHSWAFAVLRDSNDNELAEADADDLGKLKELIEGLGAKARSATSATSFQVGDALYDAAAEKLGWTWDIDELCVKDRAGACVGWEDFDSVSISPVEDDGFTIDQVNVWGDGTVEFQDGRTGESINWSDFSDDTCRKVLEKIKGAAKVTAASRRIKAGTELNMEQVCQFVKGPEGRYRLHLEDEEAVKRSKFLAKLCRDKFAKSPEKVSVTQLSNLLREGHADRDLSGSGFESADEAAKFLGEASRWCETNGWQPTKVPVSKVPKGEYFTLKAIEEPRESQVWVKGDYDKSERKYWCEKFSDTNDGRYFDKDKEVFTGFTF